LGPNGDKKMATTSDLLTTYGFYVQNLSETKKNQWQIIYYAIASQAGLWAASTKGFWLFLVVIIMFVIVVVSGYVLYKLEDTLDKYRNKQQEVINTAKDFAQKESVALDPVFKILDVKKPKKYGYWFWALEVIIVFSWLVLTILTFSTAPKPG
jgi:diacylglycerol kinase